MYIPNNRTGGDDILQRDVQAAVMHIPVDMTEEITYHEFDSIGNMESLGIIATETLGVPVALMTEIHHDYDDMVKLTVYHLGQDGRYLPNVRAIHSIGVAFDVNPPQFEGDVVLAFWAEGLVA